VIAQESRPELAGIVGRGQAPEIAGDGTFGDIESEFQKLTVNSRSAPRGILVHHPPDESSNLGIDLWPAKALWPRADRRQNKRKPTRYRPAAIWNQSTAEIRNAVLKIETNRQQVETAKVSLEFNKEQLIGEQKRFEAGLRQNFWERRFKMPPVCRFETPPVARGQQFGGARRSSA
jgi:hypothetical protein